MTQRISGKMYNAFTGEEVPDCEPGPDRTCIYRVSTRLLAPLVDSNCWDNMELLSNIKMGESVPFYTADYELPYLSPDVPYCYPCSYHLYAYASVKLGEKWILYSTGIKSIFIEEDCDITGEDFYIPIAVPAPSGCDKLFVSKYGTVMSEVKEEELERAEILVREGKEFKRYIT